MAGLIRRADIDELRSRINIADVVGEQVQLRSAGPGSLKGLCPFHDEKSASFHVRTQNGRYHCFGCGEDGDVFTFLMQMDKITFTEAVERLAHKIGFTLHYEDGGQASNEQGSRARILAVNQAAAEFFAHQLLLPDAQIARNVLTGRHFNKAAAEQFGVGYAPKSYDALSKHLFSLGFKPAELLASGVTGQGDRGDYDRFRGRLIWPIRDVSGAVLGFGARKLFDDDNGPKYLNTPETTVYRKSQVLYGLDLARKDIAKNKQVVVVEGYTDVMAAHLAGITTAVATCGTAFGSGHISVIRRIMGDDTAQMGEVIFTFDPDAAGQKAAMRAFSEEKRFTAQTYVAVGKDGLDPCDLRIQGGDEAVRQMIAGKEPMFVFAMKQVLAGHNLNTVEGRTASLRAAAPIVAQIRDASLRPGYTRELAGLLGLDLSEVQAEVSRASRPLANNQARPDTTAQPEKPKLRLKDIPRNFATRPEVETLAVLLQTPTLLTLDRIAEIIRSRFAHPALQQVAHTIETAIDHVEQPDWVAKVLKLADPDIQVLIQELAVIPLPQISEEQLKSYAIGLTASLLERNIVRQKTELLGELSRLQYSGSDPERFQALQYELQHLETLRRKYQDERI